MAAANPLPASNSNDSPEHQGCEWDSCPEIAFELVLVGCDSVPFLDVGERTLDDVAVSITGIVEWRDVLAGGIRLDHQRAAAPEPDQEKTELGVQYETDDSTEFHVERPQ